MTEQKLPEEMTREELVEALRHRDDAIEERIEALEAQSEEPQKVDLVSGGGYDRFLSGWRAAFVEVESQRWQIIGCAVLCLAACLLCVLLAGQ